MFAFPFEAKGNIHFLCWSCRNQLMTIPLLTKRVRFFSLKD